jgi:hypothetical protein
MNWTKRRDGRSERTAESGRGKNEVREERRVLTTKRMGEVTRGVEWCERVVYVAWMMRGWESGRLGKV